MYSIVTFLRGYSKFEKEKEASQAEDDRRLEEAPEEASFCGEKSYYVNPEMFSNLKPEEIPQPGGKIHIHKIESED